MEENYVPKAKRVYTEEQKQAMRERLAAARAKKAAMGVKPPVIKTVDAASTDEITAAVASEETMRVDPSPVGPIDFKETVKNSDEDTQEILKRALEAIETLAKLQAAGINTAAAAPTGPSVQNGRLVGTVTKYSIDPNDYPSPVERLKAEPRLAPFAFALNYDLDYKLTTPSYQNKDNINYVEPKFSLELHRVVRDEQTGEATGGRYVLCRLVMHEDPQAALEVARENNIDVDPNDERAFLNEMRYLQMRNWLFESFFQPIATNQNTRTEQVVGGKIVEFFEINDQNSQKLPFNELSKFRV